MTTSTPRNDFPNSVKLSPAYTAGYDAGMRDNPSTVELPDAEKIAAVVREQLLAMGCALPTEFQLQDIGHAVLELLTEKR